jgi:hypothetical protein
MSRMDPTILARLEHRYSFLHLVPRLSQGISGLRLCRFISEAEPPGCIPMLCMGTEGNEFCTDILDHAMVI